MHVEAVGIILTNIVLVIAAVWRMSAQLSKIETQLSHVNEKLKDHKEGADAFNIRLNALEARILKLEQAR